MEEKSETKIEEVLTKYQRKMMILSLEQSLLTCEEHEKEYIQRDIDALHHGFSYDYAYLNLDDEKSSEDCNLVIEILEMFRILKWSIKNNTSPSDFDAEDLKNIDYYSVFEGFDIADHGYTGEGWMPSYCQFIFDQGLYSELKDDFEKNDGGHSHSPNLKHYKTMLEKFKNSPRDTNNRNLLKAKDIKRILDPKIVQTTTSRVW